MKHSSLHVAFASFGDASSDSALRLVVHPSKGASTFSWIAQRLARRDVLTPRASTPVAQRPRQARRVAPMVDPDAQLFQCYLHVCEALYRESIEVSCVDHSSLRSATSVALTKVAHFRISFVFAHNYVCASMKFAFALFKMEGLQGGHFLLAACPESRLGPSVLARHYYSDDD
jgi:hypothetical protein